MMSSIFLLGRSLIWAAVPRRLLFLGIGAVQSPVEDAVARRPAVENAG